MSILFIEKILAQEFITLAFENLSIINIAKKISQKTNAKIKILKNTNDPRTYRLDSSKLKNTGFNQKYNVDIAIDQIIKIFKKKTNY